ncbi:alpha/beta hydrolase [Paenibacillus motobuensis]|uniref:alpha/beta hydrolase n=1 Tax=Paenibacillus TaxID=44249 RepID=UPI00203C6DF1|nr:MULTISPECIES: alpha/beta hydrolase [Paenibacillus]MCM3041106.1 alpha/beta hydrolase [Paenibacillus lutimineralis]MCM3648210.1 alpha/beta hydrolase [Paenibacillus motobuensis]
MRHIFQQGSDTNAPVLLLLHGTGGNERDLLPLAQIISPSSSVLSVRGNVLENGMPRFFRRLTEGVFDEEDLIFRTKELNDFLNQAAAEHQFDRSNIVAVGYSNGANIAGSLLFHYKDALRGAILHHPMVPRRGIELPQLSGIPVFIGAGKNDPISPAQETEELNQLLSAAGASVELHWEHFGHQLSPSEVDAATKWFQRNFV